MSRIPVGSVETRRSEEQNKIGLFELFFSADLWDPHRPAEPPPGTLAASTRSAFGSSEQNFSFTRLAVHNSPCWCRSGEQELDFGFYAGCVMLAVL